MGNEMGMDEGIQDPSKAEAEGREDLEDLDVGDEDLAEIEGGAWKYTNITLKRGTSATESETPIP